MPNGWTNRLTVEFPVKLIDYFITDGNRVFIHRRKIQREKSSSLH